MGICRALPAETGKLNGLVLSPNVSFEDVFFGGNLPLNALWLCHSRWFNLSHFTASGIINP